MSKKKTTAQKTIESYEKHEAIIENAVKLGKDSGLDVEATEGNDPKGDIRVSSSDLGEFLDVVGGTIDSNKKESN